MRHREFIQPTPEEIEQRRAMYAQAEELGIDLLSFDEQKLEASHRKDVWDAVFCLGTGQTIPEELREQLLQYKNFHDEDTTVIVQKYWNEVPGTINIQLYKED